MSLEEFQKARSEELLQRMGGSEAAQNQASATELQPEPDTPLGAERGSEGETAEPGGAGGEPEDENDAVLSQLLDNASPEQIRALAQKGQSRLLDRVSELTRRAKDAEEKLAQAQPQKQQGVEDQLQPAPDDDRPNQFSDVDSIQGLQEKVKEVDEVIEWAEDLLFMAEESRPDEVLTTVNGNQMTKADVRAALKQSQKAKQKDIPARARQLQEGQQRVQERKQYEEAARSQLPWMADEESDIKRTYDAMMADPRVAKLEEKLPELSSQFPFLIAHAANSIAQASGNNGGGKPEANGSTKAPRPKPPASPNTSASGGGRPPTRVAKALKEQQERAQKTRSFNDFVNYRAAQLSNR